MKKFDKKQTHQKVSEEFLLAREKRAADKGFQTAQWITFCRAMQMKGFDVHLYEARETVSKYITVSKKEKRFKVRFSNHKPIRDREIAGDCDFFVGITHTGRRTTNDAVIAVLEFFNGK